MLNRGDGALFEKIGYIGTTLIRSEKTRASHQTHRAFRQSYRSVDHAFFTANPGGMNR